MNATRKNALKVAKALTPAVNTYLMLKVVAEVEAERVEKIERRLLAEEFDIRVDPKWWDNPRARPKKGTDEHGRILDPDIGYLADLESDVVKAYHARMIEINLADGYACAAEGFCPALRAHSAAMKAEGDVIEAAAEFFPEFKRDIYGDLRKRALDLLTGLVVTAPGYVNPLKK